MGNEKVKRDKNETVIVELVHEARLRLYSQITAQMESKGLNSADFNQLGLGFELPAGWPVDVNSQPTLAQLTVIAKKLDMQIIINDLNLYPRKDE